MLPQNNPTLNPSSLVPETVRTILTGLPVRVKGVSEDSTRGTAATRPAPLHGGFKDSMWGRFSRQCHRGRYNTQNTPPVVAYYGLPANGEKEMHGKVSQG